MLIGKRIKDMRLEKGMSQQELGDMIGVTKVSICGYENGTRAPSLDILQGILDVFGVSADYLLGRELNVVCENGTCNKISMPHSFCIIYCFKIMS